MVTSLIYNYTLALAVDLSALLALSALSALALAQPQSRCVIEFCVLSSAF